MGRHAGPKILTVAAASRHGATCDIADRLVAGLTDRLGPEWTVGRADVEDLPGLERADAVVLGSAIYYGRWMRPARKALEHLRTTPPSHLWLFSTGPVSEDETENVATVSADALADLASGADGHMVFGGKLDAEKLSALERIVVRVVHAESGDHRDWAAVDEWAAHIASALGAASPGEDDTPSSRAAP